MTITAAVKKILGPVLEERGFRYTKLESFIWSYVREREFGKGEDFQIVRQDVMVQKSNWGKELYLNFCIQRRAIHYRPSFYYKDEQGMLRVIKCFLEIIQKDDYEILRKMDVQSTPRIPKSQCPSGLQNERLYNEHADLMRKFLKRENIQAAFEDSEPFIDISAEEGADIIKRVIKENRHASFKDSEELVLELSAFYGYLLLKKTLRGWVLNTTGDEPRCAVGGYNYPISVIHYCWYAQDFEKNSETLQKRIDNAVPDYKIRVANYLKEKQLKERQLDNEETEDKSTP